MPRCNIISLAYCVNWTMGDYVRWQTYFIEQWKHFLANWDYLIIQRQYMHFIRYNLGQKVLRFALSYPQNVYPADLVPLWPLPSPHPGQICLFGIRNDPAGLQQCFFFFGGGGGIEYLQLPMLSSFILKLDVVSSIFLNIFFKIVDGVSTEPVIQLF